MERFLVIYLTKKNFYIENFLSDKEILDYGIKHNKFWTFLKKIEFLKFYFRETKKKYWRRF